MRTSSRARRTTRTRRSRSRTPSGREELAAQDELSQYFMAELDGRPIGAMQICDPHLETSHYWGEIAPNLRAIDIWIGAPADRGKGYGTQMMRLALERCFADSRVTGDHHRPACVERARARVLSAVGIQAGRPPKLRPRRLPRARARAARLAGARDASGTMTTTSQAASIFSSATCSCTASPARRRRSTSASAPRVASASTDRSSRPCSAGDCRPRSA